MAALRRSRPLRLLIPLAAAALLATACGGTDAAETGADGGDDAVAAAAEGADGAGDAEGMDTSDWPNPLVFAAVPAEESSSLQESYGLTIQLIEDATGLDVEFRQATNYAGVIEGMVAGRVHLAQFGPFSYVIARTAGAEIQPIGAMVDAKGEEPGYQSYAITQADNDEINSLADFAGRNICFVDPGSTSGFLYPSAGLLAEGIDPESDVNGTFAGGHDSSALSVARGDCEAGFAFDSMVDTSLVEDGSLTGDELKVVWKSDVIAGSPLAVQSGLPAELLDLLATVVLERANIEYLVAEGICESEEGCKISDEDNWGYSVVDDSFYDGVRNVCEETQSAKCDPANA